MKNSQRFSVRIKNKYKFTLSDYCKSKNEHYEILNFHKWVDVITNVVIIFSCSPMFMARVTSHPSTSLIGKIAPKEYLMFFKMITLKNAYVCNQTLVCPVFLLMSHFMFYLTKSFRENSLALNTMRIPPSLLSIPNSQVYGL